ncbi:unnamed protein product [Colias eurytheme]|nr:unnamed protein product [Colias eurytheme]
MEATVKAYNRVLSMAGVTIFCKKNWNSKKWLTFQILTLLSIFFAIISSTAFTFSCLPDLHLSIESAVVASTFYITFLTLYLYLGNKRKFENFLTEMVFNDPALENPFIKYVLNSRSKGDKMRELKSLVISSQERLLRVSRFLSQMYSFCIAFVVTLYMFAPMYTSKVREDNSTRILPLDMSFPWSTNNIVIYILTFMFQVHVGYLCSIGFASFITLLLLFILQIRRQLNILSLILYNFNEMVLEITGGKSDDWEPACDFLLSLCVGHYLKTKRFARELNKVYKPYFLGLVLSSISLEGVCFVKIALLQELTLHLLKYGVHLTLLMVGICIFSYQGQMIDDACAELEAAATEKWYIFNRQHQKKLLIFLIALSQRMPVYIYGSVTLTFETFTWFVKTGMSFFTLMMSVLEK